MPESHAPDPERELADAALRQLIARLGLAFHPEVEVWTYIQTSDGENHDAGLLQAMRDYGGFEGLPEDVAQTFTEEDAKYYQACLDIAWHVYGDGIFDEIKKIEPWKTYFEELGEGEI